VIDAYARPKVVPFRIRSPLPSALGYCIVVDNFLAASECRAFIAQAESTGFVGASPDYPPSYRNNDRLVVDDVALAQKLHARLQSIAANPLSAPAGEQTESWRLDSVNTRLRFCRYTSNQQFNIHQDGVHHRSLNCRSMLTFMIYLNDGSDFSGGDTLFFANGPRTDPNANPVVARLRPKMGTLILFDHRIWHAGETVTSGTKYIMRSDVLFSRIEESVAGAVDVPEVAHCGYVWTLARLDDHHFASGGRDGRIRLWDDAGSCTGELAGHTQSVLGLARIDDEHLASVSRDRTLQIWDLKTRQRIRATVAHGAAVLTVATIGKGRLATGAADHKIKVWSKAGEELATIPAHTGWVWKIVRLTDSLMASASEDGSVKVWSNETFDMLACLDGVQSLRSIAVSPNGISLATGDASGQLRVWKNLLGRPTLEAETSAHDSAIRCVHFIDAETIATGGEDCRLKIWRDRPLRVIYETQHENFVTDFHALAPHRGASCSYDGRISFHNWCDRL
jgi:predicted 2-oxoglutarate/Fe(II)-dependent dioxygenase YbiX